MAWTTGRGRGSIGRADPGVMSRRYFAQTEARARALR
jgi:hypothetical protein